MQLVIPMSGLGSRFVAAGYDQIKPLIEVFGRPMIAWVLHGIPAQNVTFICRDRHLQETALGDVLRTLVPEARVLAIPGHKQGPVYALQAAFPVLDAQQPVLVSYCDYYMHWDYAGFCAGVAQRDCAGAIPCYTGFHPHLLPAANLYASCQTDERDNLIEIREKYSFAADKTRALHSPGAYYFRSAALMQHYCEQQLAHGEAINGEHYVSLVYNAMVADGLDVWVPANVEHFCQWGTPADLQDCEYWVTRARGFAQ